MTLWNKIDAWLHKEEMNAIKDILRKTFEGSGEEYEKELHEAAYAGLRLRRVLGANLCAKIRQETINENK